jgi:hypothetical protein
VTTPVITRATRPDLVAQECGPIDADGLVVEIERYLAARIHTTAHPLVSKTTSELVAEALGSIPVAPAPVVAAVPAGPPRLLRLLPDWVLAVPLLRRTAAGRTVSVAEHLELTALVIERWGWAQNRYRSRSGRRCILGAQAALYRLGYGDEDTITAAGRRIQQVLTDRKISQPFHEWNDGPGRDQCEVLTLLRTAAANARA